METMNESTPLAVYNTEEKELIGVYDSIKTATKCLFNTADYAQKRRVVRALTHKVRLQCDKYPFEVAIRPASDEHKRTLGNYKSVVLPKYA